MNQPDSPRRDQPRRRALSRQSPRPTRIRPRRRTQEKVDATAAAGLPPKVSARLQAVVAVRDALASLALLSIPALALRILWVARFDIHTALALIQYTSMPVFIASNVVILAPAFSTGVGFTLFLYQQARFPIRRDSKLTWVAAAAAYLAYLLLALPLILQSDILSVFAPLILPSIVFQASPNGGVLRWFGWPMIAMFAFLMLYRPVIWLPPENVQFASNTRTLYVLSIQVPDVITYDQDQNLIERFPISSIKHRAFCDTGPTGSIAEQLFGRPAIESCVGLLPHVDSVASFWSTSAAHESGQQPRNYAFWIMR